MSQPTTIALLGAPNCGKTSLFNSLTGSRQKVANYTGVTVEHKLGHLTLAGGHKVTLLDLPGSYSLRARSSDEAITRDIVLGKQPGAPVPDMVLCVADANNLRVHLRLVMEAKQLGIPVILAINMIDIATHRGIELDLERASQLLGIPVVATSAVRRKTMEPLLACLTEAVNHLPTKKPDQHWQEPDTQTIKQLNRQVGDILSQITLSEAKLPTRHGMDRWLLHPVFGMLALLSIVFCMFQAVFAWATPMMDALDAGFIWLGNQAAVQITNPTLQSLVRDGIIAGIGSVVIFLPQILLLYSFILVMEATGYMARAAFLLDRVMGRVGLHGKSFIPLLSAFACAIPAIMATRTIEHPRDRLITIMIIPLMTCSARLPVYTLLIAAFIPAMDVTIAGMAFGLQGLVMFALYAAAVLSGIAIAGVIRLCSRHRPAEPFLLELPSYQWPDATSLAVGLLERAKIFLKQAGTVIFIMMLVLWFAMNYPKPPENTPSAQATEHSLAGRIGHAIEPIFAPIGFNWQIAVALIPGMAAREVAVASLGAVYAAEGTDDEAITTSLRDRLAKDWSLPMALSFLTWYIFAPQCLSTLAIAKRELNSWKWTWIMTGYLFALAYLASFITYRTAMALLA